MVQKPLLKSMLTVLSISISSLVFAAPNPTDSADFFMQKGMLEKQNGRRMESLKQFEKAFKYDSSSKVITTELASAYYDLRKYHQSLQLYKKLIGMGETTAPNYKQVMMLSYHLRQQNDVLHYADLLQKADPNEPIHYYVGKVHYDMENYGGAIQALTIAAKEDPKNAEVPYMIARSYADMMNYKQSIPYFKQAIEMDTAQSHWVYELGLICYAMNDNTGALQYILMAGDRGYKRDNAYLENLGIAYLDAGKLYEGVAILNDVLKRKPSDLNVLNMVAEAYYFAGKYVEAIEYWDKVMLYDN
ncbi:MAG: tetratricopeptide repeat protein, partial [Pedobacter sp.]